MTIKFTNNATTSLASGITNSATSLTVTTGDGAKFPSLSGSDVFYATLANSSGVVEIVKVTARSTDTFTIVRGQDGTTAVSWLTGDTVELRPTAVSMTEMAQKSNNLSDLASAATARTNLGATTVGSNLMTLTNPSAVTFPRINADNTVSTLDAATFRGAIGAGTGSGTVTSVATGGGLTGGTITGSGTLSVDLTYGAIGDVVLASSSNYFLSTVSSRIAAGTTVAGSTLVISSATNASITPGNMTSNTAYSSLSLSGTWRAQSPFGRQNAGCGDYQCGVTLWKRIS